MVGSVSSQSRPSLVLDFSRFLDSGHYRKIRVEYGNAKKYIKVPDIDGRFDLVAFLQEVTLKFSWLTETSGKLCLTDDMDTEISANIFDELVKSGIKQFKVHCHYPLTDLQQSTLNDRTDTMIALQPTASSSLDDEIPKLSSSSSDESDSTIILPSTVKRKVALGEMDRNEWRQNVESVLRSHPKGKNIFFEYDKTKRLSDGTRRLMVNIIVTEMTKSYGIQPPRDIRASYAMGIVALFPYLEDPFSRNGFEHFYDPYDNTGFLAWRLKTVQRKSRQTSTSQAWNTPTTQRQFLVSAEQLVGEECMKLLSEITHSTNQILIKENMRATFEYRQKLVHDKQEGSFVFDIFPRFLDTPGLIEQDFCQMFGDNVSGKLMIKWPTYFKSKVIAECRKIPSIDIRELLSTLDSGTENEHDWDSDVISLLLLLHLLPPTLRGSKKICPVQAAERLFKFVKDQRILSTFLETKDIRQPFLLCIGKKKKKIEKFFIVMDQTALPCATQTTLAAFDILFKAHYVFNVSYDEALSEDEVVRDGFAGDEATGNESIR
ncbi:hypothetical protein WMY93_031779 [Mugilogobius chulae]|uniref:Uncharacterized protein n=1 Tax=Mugilogobius chulae TaxID=88201 RepID=A0AAW0ML90_9GOBI